MDGEFFDRATYADNNDIFNRTHYEDIFCMREPRSVEDIEAERRERLARTLECMEYRDATVVTLGNKTPVVNADKPKPARPDDVYTVNIDTGKRTCTMQLTAAELHPVPYFRTIIDNGKFTESEKRTVDVAIQGACTDSVAQYAEWLRVRAKGRSVMAAFKKLYDPSIMIIAHYFNDDIFLGPTVQITPTANVVSVTVNGKQNAFALRPDLYTEREVLDVVRRNVAARTGVDIEINIEETAAGSHYTVNNQDITLNMFGRGLKRFEYIIPHYDNALVPSTFPEGYPVDYVETLIADYMDWAVSQGTRWHCRLNAFMSTLAVANAAWTEDNRRAIALYFGAPAKTADELAKMTTERAAQYTRDICKRHPKDAVDTRLTRNTEYTRMAASVNEKRSQLRRYRNSSGMTMRFMRRQLITETEMELENLERMLDVLAERILRRR